MKKLYNKQNGLLNRLDMLHDTLIEDYNLNPEKEQDMDLFTLLEEIGILAEAQHNVITILNNKQENVSTNQNPTDNVQK